MDRENEDRLARKREREMKTVSEMIALYCRGVHGRGRGDGLCASCRELDAYARQRSAKCPLMEHKTFCSVCPVHCYRPEIRERVRAVMRYSGPRMLFHHPVMAIRHLLETVRQKRRVVGGGSHGRESA